jgi:hypothetical protein
MSAIYEERDGLFVPSGHAGGPWDAGSQHGGGPAALMARAVERLESPGPMLLARLSIDFLGAVPMAPVAVESRIAKPGRRLQLAEVSLSAEGRDVCRGRAVLIRREPVPVPAQAVPGPRIAPPDGVEPEPMPLLIEGAEEGFARTGMELRFVEGRFLEPGAATAWFRLKLPLVAGEEPSPAQRAVAAADFGNGMSAELAFASHLFVNTELTVHLAREPVGEWIGVEGVTEHGPEGTALSASVLHDSDGPVGRGAQSLFVAER